MKLEIFNETNEDISEYQTIIEQVLAHGLKKLAIKEAVFNIIFVNNDYIHKLNQEYRHVDRETDVITFALQDDKTFNPEGNVLGDIYISLDKAKSQSMEYGHSLKRELCFLAVHGLLHLLGYDHMNESDEKKMFDLQEDILNEMGITR